MLIEEQQILKETNSNIEANDGIKEKIDICIIGGGLIGCFLANKLSDAGFSVYIIEASNNIGGQLHLYHEKEIFNIPFVEKIKAKDIVDVFAEKIKNSNNCVLKLETRADKIVKTNTNDFNVLINDTENKKKYYLNTKYIILSYGNGEIAFNKPSIENIENYENKTIFYKIDNEDKFLNKNIVIFGGGDSAIDWACEMTKIAKNTTIIHRRKISKPDNENFLSFTKLCNGNKIRALFPYTIKNIIGDKKNGVISNVEVLNLETNITEQIQCDYVMIFYGLKTLNNVLLKNSDVKILHKIGLANVNNVNLETSEKNIFAVGDCCEYEGKIKNIPIGISEALKCFYEICKREKNNINIH